MLNFAHSCRCASGNGGVRKILFLFNPVMETTNKTSTQNNPSLSTNKFAKYYTPAEEKELAELYEEVLPVEKEHEIVEGTIIGIDGRDIILNVGLKSDGVLSISEFKDMSELKIGDKVEVYVEEQENSKGQLLLSRKKARLVRGWEIIQDAAENKKVLEGIVKRRTRGGLIVEIFEVEAFLPGSQIDIKPVLDFDAFVGKKIDVGVLKINYSNDNVVVSHKMLIEKDLESQRDTIMSNLERGQVLEGIVKNMTDYGAFINLGGVDGLLHITDITWNKISRPSDVLKLGEKVKVVITEFDEEKHRISLGMKQLTPHPWDLLAEDIQVGTKVNAKVTKITDYGAFLAVQDGVEGLLHVSEMSWSQYVRNPRDLLKEGDKLDVVVLSLDREEKKMALGLKQLTPDPWTKENFAADYAAGTKHKGIVKDMSRSFSFVEFEPGVRGLLHISDMSWTQKVNHPSEILKLETEVEVIVLDVDIENKKLSLGLKQLEEDPWDSFQQTFSVGSVHKGTMLKKTEKGAIIQLPYGLEGYAPQRGLLKEDKQPVVVGDALDFQVIDFIRDEHRILLSHTATFAKDTREERGDKDKRPRGGKSRSTAPRNLITAEKSTLGDIEALSSLKSKMTQEEGAAPKKEKASKKEEEDK